MKERSKCEKKETNVKRNKKTYFKDIIKCEINKKCERNKQMWKERNKQMWK